MVINDNKIKRHNYIDDNCKPKITMLKTFNENNLSVVKCNRYP